MSALDIDVLVAGGGPAGLSAALVLGRCHRRVLLCDDARQRNRLIAPTLENVMAGKNKSTFSRWNRTERLGFVSK